MIVGKVYFDKYKVLEKIGAGGTSEVFLVENIKLGNKWAIKKINKKPELNLLAEANILKDLSHEGIPSIIDIEESPDSLYIIQEYIRGVNLKEYKLNNETIDYERIIDWILQLCNTLKYLHNRKPYPIIYRDLKPENIMVSEDKKIKLIDFGISREFKEERLNDTNLLGSQGYAAPEQFGLSQSDERTDIYSLGITIYFLITGKNLSNPPYKIQRLEELNNNIEEDLLDIVYKCCETLPEHRYQTIEEVELDLRDLKDPNPIRAEDRVFKEAIKERQEYPSIKKTIIIGLIGVGRGVGVTHTSIMLGSFLSKRKRVGIIEMNSSSHFREIGLIVGGRKEIEEKILKYKRVDYYWDIDFNKFLSNHRDAYDFILIDFGSYEEISDINEYIRCDIRMVIGQGMDWKVKEIYEFNRYNKNYDPKNSWIYLIPFLDKKSIRDLKLQVKNKIYPLPFNMNPFKPSLDSKKILEKTL